MSPITWLAILAGGAVGLIVVLGVVRLGTDNGTPADAGRKARARSRARNVTTGSNQAHHFHRGAEIRRVDGLVGTVRETWTHEAEVRLDTGEVLRIAQFDPEWRKTTTRSIEMPFERHSVRS